MRSEGRAAGRGEAAGMLPMAGSAGGPISGWRRTPALERWLHHAATALVVLSGLVYAWAKYLVEPPPDVFAVVNHPLEPWALHLHVLSAPLAVLALGLILREHIWARIRSGRRPGRRTGLFLTWLVLPMIASGYLLQTVTGEGLSRILVWVHLVTGGLYLFLYLAHVFVTLRGRIKNGLRGPAAPSSAASQASQGEAVTR